jgi:hypothetical protein
MSGREFLYFHPTRPASGKTRKDRFGSKAAVARRLMAQLVCPQLRK